MKLDYQAIWDSFKATAFSKTGRIIAGLAIVLIGAALYMTDCGSDWAFRRGVNKLQANVNAALDDAANLKREEANLQQRKIEANANVNAAVAEYQEQVFGHEEAKKETNQALANYNKALAANSTNVDATKEDVLKALEKLNQ